MDYDTLDSFKKIGFGLITPDDKLLVVSFYGHFDELKRYPEFKSDIEDFNDMLSEEAESFSDNIPDDAHPEWHLYEMWADDARHEFRAKILEKAYHFGWGRIGTFYNANQWMIELECSKEHEKRLQKIAQEIATMLDCGLKVTPR